MELVSDANGDAAPRLNDVQMSAFDAQKHHHTLIREVVRMLCAGVVHGDLSEFNILMAHDGPVIIDLPQAVDAAGNNHAKRMLLRDVNNLKQYFGQFEPALLSTQYGDEIWDLFARGLLTPDTDLTGRFVIERREVDLRGVMREIDQTVKEHQIKRDRVVNLRRKL
jgi:RIO kinase 1